MNKYLKTIIKLVVTASGLYLAYRQFNIQEVQLEWQDVLPFFGFAIAFNLLNILITSIRTRVLLQNNISIWSLFKITIIGSFFNLFLPSTIGGDISRVYNLSKETKALKKSAEIIFLDRLVGVTGMGILGLSGYVLLVFSSLGIDSLIGIVLVSFMLIVLLVWGAIYFDSIYRIFVFWGRFSFLKFVVEHINKVRSGLRVSRKQFWVSLILSILFHLNSSWIVFNISQALGLDISIIYFLAIIPMTNILLLVPISISGLGVRDYIFLVFYGALTSATNVSLLAPFTFLLFLVTGTVGGLVYLFETEVRKSE